MKIRTTASDRPENTGSNFSSPAHFVSSESLLVVAANAVMLPAIKMVSRLLTLSVLFMASAFGQSADNTGWSELPWGTTKPVALKTLQPLGAHECNRTTDASCVEAAGVDVLVVEKYNFNQVPFRVNLLFTSKNGLSKALMTADDKGTAFEKVLSQLTAQYGKPGLQSEYDGVEELLHTTWTWLKAHGKVSLDSEETSGTFTVTYEARR
jgi:hypothetical protein